MKFQKTVDLRNKKAKFEYALLDEYSAGIILTGTEIKSVRESKVSMADAYALIDKGELILKNLNISTYENGTHYNHEPLRDRKLLLNKREIKKIASKLLDKGLTVVLTRFYINDKGLAKVDIAVAKGKKLYDKRDSIKEKDVMRDQDRER
jgi:SsrA-binding protein